MSEQEVNETILEQEFNLDDTEEVTDTRIEAINEMRRQLMLAGQEEDPDVILLQNIDRANTLLDTAQHAIENGGETNARLFEVCAQLINAITSAATSVQNSTFGMQKHEYNMKMIAVKEKELVVKQAIAQGKLESQRDKREGGGSKNVVVMSREELLKMIEKEEADVEVNSAGEEGTD